MIAVQTLMILTAVAVALIYCAIAVSDRQINRIDDRLTDLCKHLRQCARKEGGSQS